MYKKKANRFSDQIEVVVPTCYSEKIISDRNISRQLLSCKQKVSLEQEADGQTEIRFITGERCHIVRSRIHGAISKRALLVPGSIPLDSIYDLSNRAEVRWIGNLRASSPIEVLKSLENAFTFLQEDPSIERRGLRIPQIGAVHAVLGYWTTNSNDPCTVVMPTGTGKTEAMLALFASERLMRLLIMVPSDALRNQLAAKFESFGVLQQFGVISAKALYPVVGQVRHKFSSSSTAHDFAIACNVIIATPNALDACEATVRSSLLSSCSHFFVDEAHHVAAETWRQIRDEFEGKPIVQFTATPFREDGHHLGGRLLYAFPLREAQKQGFFSNINYISTVDFENQDKAIAVRAIKQLREDIRTGYDHILMVRVMRIGRADEMLKLYRELAPDLSPVLLHSRESSNTRRASLDAIHTRKSRIIVCVDMLGEGFDLPSLKIAAIHDPHKSLGVTLQFIGRFARVAGISIGDATVVVGRPDLDYDDHLRRLYSEDANWNLIIRDLSEGAVSYQQELSEFESGFGSLPEEVSLRNLLPKMSTVLYRTHCSNWNPLAATLIYPEEQLLTIPIAINKNERVAWFVTENRSQVRWGNLQTVQEVFYDLFILYWDSNHQILYINSSDNDNLHEELAKAVCGDDAKRITGEQVYRAMAQVKRLVPTNVGVLDIRNRARRFSMHVGADVSEGFPIAEAQTKTKTNIFAYGYEDGNRISIGASLKGRVWSFRIATSLKQWVDWCNHVGNKLIDDNISIDEIMKYFIRPTVVEERPAYVALGLEWPWEVFQSTSEEVRIGFNGSNWPLVDTDLTITLFSSTGPIPFKVSTSEWDLEYEATLGNGKIEFAPMGAEATIIHRWTSEPLSQYLCKSGLIFFFEQDAIVMPPGIFIKPDREIPPFDSERLQPLDWSGVNLHKESQGAGRDKDSIQARTIEYLLMTNNWDLVIDDDGSGEIADIVAIRIQDEKLLVHLVHCKYASEDPGGRVIDLYEVCGQAQKSVIWRRNVDLFFKHLIRREKNRKKRQNRSGIEKGAANTIYELEDRSRLLKPTFMISVVQPGVSKANVSRSQLELLASTELYVYETANSSFNIFCSS